MTEKQKWGLKKHCLEESFSFPPHMSLITRFKTMKIFLMKWDLWYYAVLLTSKSKFKPHIICMKITQLIYSSGETEWKVNLESEVRAKKCGVLNSMLKNRDSIQIMSSLIPSMVLNFFNQEILKYSIYCLNLKTHFELQTAYEISKSIIVIHEHIA